MSSLTGMYRDKKQHQHGLAWAQGWPDNSMSNQWGRAVWQPAEHMPMQHAFVSPFHVVHAVVQLRKCDPILLQARLCQ